VQTGALPISNGAFFDTVIPPQVCRILSGAAGGGLLQVHRARSPGGSIWMLQGEKLTCTAVILGQTHSYHHARRSPKCGSVRGLPVCQACCADIAPASGGGTGPPPEAGAATARAA